MTAVTFYVKATTLRQHGFLKCLYYNHGMCPTVQYVYTASSLTRFSSEDADAMLPKVPPLRESARTFHAATGSWQRRQYDSYDDSAGASPCLHAGVPDKLSFLRRVLADRE